MTRTRVGTFPKKHQACPFVKLPRPAVGGRSEECEPIRHGDHGLLEQDFSHLIADVRWTNKQLVEHRSGRLEGQHPDHVSVANCYRQLPPSRQFRVQARPQFLKCRHDRRTHTRQARTLVPNLGNAVEFGIARRAQLN